MTRPILIAMSFVFVMLQVQCFSDDRVSHFMIIADTNHQESGGDAAADRDHLSSTLSMSFGGDASKMRLHIIDPLPRMSKLDFFSLVRSKLGLEATQPKRHAIALFLIGRADEIWTAGKLTELRFKLTFVDETITRSELLTVAKEYRPDLLICVTENLTDNTGPSPKTEISAIRSDPCTALAQALFIDSSGEHLIHGCSDGQKCQSLTVKPTSTFSGSNFVSSFCTALLTYERETIDWTDFLTKVDTQMMSSIEEKSTSTHRLAKQRAYYQRGVKAEK